MKTSGTQNHTIAHSNISAATSKPVRSDNFVGASWALAAVFLFSIIFISGRIVDGSATAIQVLWFRYFGGLLTGLAVVFIKRIPLADLKTTQPLIHAVRATAGGLGTAAGIYVAIHLPIAVATAIGLTDGVLTVFLAVLFLKERLTRGQWLASLLCLAAAQVVVAKSGPSIAHAAPDPVVLIIAVAGALSLATENILIKTIARAEPPIRVLLYVNLFGSLIFLLPAIYLGDWNDSPVLVALLILGPIAILAQFCNIRAFIITDASIVASMRYTWIIFAAMFGMIFFGEVPGLIFYLGAAVILGSGLWLAKSR